MNTESPFSSQLYDDEIGRLVKIAASVSLTAFGDTEEPSAGAFFTGKPFVDGLGYAFLLRNYRPDHGKWLTADPLGYPDGWNSLAYCGNESTFSFDLCGGQTQSTSIGGISYSWNYSNARIGGITYFPDDEDYPIQGSYVTVKWILPIAWECHRTSYCHATGNIDLAYYQLVYAEWIKGSIPQDIPTFRTILEGMGLIVSNVLQENIDFPCYISDEIFIRNILQSYYPCVIVNELQQLAQVVGQNHQCVE